MPTLESKPLREEINSHTIKLIIGGIAFALPFVSWTLNCTLTSISESYIFGGWSRNIFVGSLCAIAAFLCSYNGQSTFEMGLSRAAAICALGVTFFECTCGRENEGTKLHMVFAVGMFLILAVFCYIFLNRARAKPGAKAKRRVVIYWVCGIALVVAITVLAIDMAGHNFITAKCPSLVFWGEALGLVAFGTAWLTASRTIKFLTDENERYLLSPFKDKPPGEDTAPEKGSATK